MKTTLIFKELKRSLHKEFGTSVSYKSLQTHFVDCSTDKDNAKDAIFDPQFLSLMGWFLCHPDLSNLRDWVLLRRLFFKHHGAKLLKLLSEQYVNSTQPIRIPVKDYGKLFELFVQIKHSGAVSGVSYLRLAYVIVRSFDIPYTVQGVKNALFDRDVL